MRRLASACACVSAPLRGASASNLVKWVSGARRLSSWNAAMAAAKLAHSCDASCAQALQPQCGDLNEAAAGLVLNSTHKIRPWLRQSDAQ